MTDEKMIVCRVTLVNNVQYAVEMPENWVLNAESLTGSRLQLMKLTKNRGMLFVQGDKILCVENLEKDNQ